MESLANASGATMTGRILCDITLESTTFKGCTPINVELRGSKVHNTHLRKSQIHDSATRDSYLCDCKVAGGSINDCKVFDSKIVASSVRNCEMRSCSQTTPLALSKFSAEIRCIIYEYMMQWDGKSPSLLAVLRGMPQYYSEALKVFYKTNCFVLNAWNYENCEMMGQSAVEGIKNLHIEVSPIEEMIPAFPTTFREWLVSVRIFDITRQESVEPKRFAYWETLCLEHSNKYIAKWMEKSIMTSFSATLDRLDAEEYELYGAVLFQNEE